MIGMKAAEASVSFLVLRQLMHCNASEDQALNAMADTISIN